MFLVSQKNHTYRSPNMMKLFDDFFWNIRDPRSFGRNQEELRGPHMASLHAQGVGRAPWPYGPHGGPSDLISGL